MEAAVGAASGLSTGELDALRAPSATALLSVLKRRDVDLPWLDLPYQESVVQEVAEFANDVRGRFKNVVVLGIGGSALGNTALHTALNSPFHNLDPPPGIPRLFVLDNVDPDLVGELLDLLNPAETLFNVVSKSGSTAETVSQFLVFRQALVDCIGAEDHVEHICVTTDPMQGPLFEVAVREGYRRFAVPDGVGGRFSVLSAVGLVPAALVGIDVQGLCRGAAAMDERCKNPELLENPALVHAALQFLLHTRKQKPIAVTFSYSHRLRDCADWYAQLLAESIGKRRNRAGEEVFCGPSPVRAVGVTDQHSQVQLYTEGPFDKWFMFLAVENHDHQVVIPPHHTDIESLGCLADRTLGELFGAEREGTRVALSEAGRPNAMITLDGVNAHSVGQLLYMLELSVALMGEHYNVDAFDQPGVEAGKNAAWALLGRKGYEARRESIKARRSGPTSEV